MYPFHRQRRICRLRYAKRPLRLFSGLVRGLSVGFAASAFIGLSNINLILIITGSVLLVGGIVMMILQATGALKLGKGAQAQ